MVTATAGDTTAAPTSGASGEPKWASNSLRKHLRRLYDAGTHDAFITAVERIARRHPPWLFRDDASVISQLHALLPKVHGEPRYVLLTALSHTWRSAIPSRVLERRTRSACCRGYPTY